ncbi:MAG: hypothetical protein LBB98_10375 [Treponema sp.]|jgi:hypothetical protein|nr:hypothetical protein [Treponema sp.]
MKNPAFASSYSGLVMKHGDVIVALAGETGGEKNSLVKTEELFNYARGRQGEFSIVSSRVWLCEATGMSHNTVKKGVIEIDPEKIKKTGVWKIGETISRQEWASRETGRP